MTGYCALGKDASKMGHPSISRSERNRLSGNEGWREHCQHFIHHRCRPATGGWP